MQSTITYIDFLLLPLYLGLFYLLVKNRASKILDPEMRRIYYTAFALRMAGSVLYSLVVVFYYGYGDSYTYYNGSTFLVNQLKSNFSNISFYFAPIKDFQQWYTLNDGSDIGLTGHTGNEAAALVMKITSLTAFLSFNRFMLMGLFFGVFSFLGQWKLFQVFDYSNKGYFRKLMAIAILYTPSIWFWGSGILKDSLCLGGAGFIIYAVYSTFEMRKISLRYLLLLPAMLYMVYVIKSYIVLILLISFLVVFISRNLLLIKNILLRIVTITVFVIALLGIASVLDFSNEINKLVEESYTQIQSYSKNYEALQAEDESSKAAVELGNVDASLSSIILKSPEKIFTALYRPFLWESKKLIIFFTSLESTLLLLATLYLLIKSRFIGFFRICFSNGLIFFSLTVSILFALIIGFTTFNFGTMIRYKIILLPFYYFMLVAVFTKIQEKQAAMAGIPQS